MKNVKYANIANELLGNDIYLEFIKEISKEHGDENLIDFGENVLNKACFLIVMIGMSKKIKLDNVQFCLGGRIVEVSCKEFARKYEQYAKKIEENVFETLKDIKA